MLEIICAFPMETLIKKMYNWEGRTLNDSMAQKANGRQTAMVPGKKKHACEGFLPKDTEFEMNPNMQMKMKRTYI